MTHLNYKMLASALLTISLMPLQSEEANKEDTEQNDRSSTDNVVTSIATRVVQPLKDVPLSISVISSAELGLINHSHIQESLNRIPGVNLHRGDGQEYLPAIRSQVFTGAGACGAVLMLEDNIPIRPAGFCNINELFESVTELASRIEVIRGPGTVFYGSNALHGVINVVTSTPLEGGLASLEIGNDGLYRSRLNSGFVGESHKLGLAVIAGRYEGWREESSYDQQKLSVRHEYVGNDFTLMTGLSTTNLNQETAGYIVGENSYLDRQFSATNTDREGYRDVESLRLWTRLDVEYSADSSLSITPYIRRSDMNFMMHFLPGDPVEENGQESFGVQTNYQFKVSDFMRIKSGIDIESADTYLRQTQVNSTPGSAFLQATIPAGKQYDYQVDTTVVSVFASLEQQLTEQLVTSAGVRWESLKYDYTNLMNSGRLTEQGLECGFGGCRYTRPESSINEFDNWSADANLKYSLTSESQLFSRITRAFRAPQATELYRLQRAQTVADLDSENITAIELGYRLDLPDVTFQATAYRMQKKNYIFRDANFFNISGGQTKHMGIELALNYQWLEDWYWDLSAAYAKHQYDYDSIVDAININGNYIDSAPKLTLNNRVGWANETTNIQLEWIHADEYYLEPTNQFVYSGHDLLHLLLIHQLTTDWQIKGRIHNLFDTNYAERADYTSFTGYRYFPGIPRQVSLSISYSW